MTGIVSKMNRKVPAGKMKEKRRNEFQGTEFIYKWYCNATIKNSFQNQECG